VDNRLKLETARDALDRVLTDSLRHVALEAMDPLAKAYFSCATQAISIAIGHIDTTLRHGTDEPIDGAVTRGALGFGATAIVDGRTGELVA
jgi:hypothetical protein